MSSINRHLPPLNSPHYSDSNAAQNIPISQEFIELFQKLVWLFPNLVTLHVPTHDMWILFKLLTPWTSEHMLVLKNYNNINHVAITTIINHNKPLIIQYKNYSRYFNYVRCSDRSQFIYGVLQVVLKLMYFTIQCVHICFHIHFISYSFSYLFLFLFLYLIFLFFIDQFHLFKKIL